MTPFVPHVDHTPEHSRTPKEKVWALGIDLSLTATGYAVVRDSGIETGLVKSSGKKDDTLAQRYERLHGLLDALNLPIDDDTMVVIEQPAYAAVGGSHHDRSGLWWMVVGWYLKHGFYVAEVPPTVVKKYATGAGNADKDTVLAATIRRYPTTAVSNNNVADAITLAVMGARYMGRPQEADTVKISEAMDVVRWPL